MNSKNLTLAQILALPKNSTPLQIKNGTTSYHNSQTNTNYLFYKNGTIRIQYFSHFNFGTNTPYLKPKKYSYIIKPK